MLIMQTDYYVKACMKTWLLCESCAYAETLCKAQRRELIEKCRACAKACFALVSEIISGAEPLSDTAFTCLLSCRECYVECEKYSNENDIEFCGEVCRLCGNMLKDLIVPFHLN